MATATEEIQLVTNDGDDDDIEVTIDSCNKVTVDESYDDDDVNDVCEDEKFLERQNTEQIHKEEHFGPLQVERYLRLIGSIIFMFGAFMIFWYKKQSSPYRNVAYCMALVQSLWFIQFLGVVLTIKHLHSVVVFRKIVPNTLFLVVPYKIKEYDTIIMSSISAMSSMRGSNLFYMLGASSNIVFGMTFSCVSFKWHEIQKLTWDAVSLGLLLLSSFGATVITSWELDTTSKLSTWLHYLGAAMAFGSAPVAFAMYQEFSALSIMLMLVTYLCLAVFGSVYAFAQPQYDDNPAMVHRVSMFCIIVELIAVVNGMVCVILFIYCMEGDKIL